MLALPFVLAALPVLFTIDGPAPAQPALRPVHHIAGLERFLSIALKSWISIQAAILLATTTSFPDILLAMRALRLPRLLVAIIGLMWRYMFVIVDEVLRLLRARSSRSAHSPQPGLRPGGTLWWRARVTGGMAGSLFLRSWSAPTASTTPCSRAATTAKCAACPSRASARRIGLTLAAGLSILLPLLISWP